MCARVCVFEKTLFFIILTHSIGENNLGVTLKMIDSVFYTYAVVRICTRSLLCLSRSAVTPPRH